MKCGGSQRSLGLWEDSTEEVVLEGGCKDTRRRPRVPQLGPPPPIINQVTNYMFKKASVT